MEETWVTVGERIAVRHNRKWAKGTVVSDRRIDHEPERLYNEAGIPLQTPDGIHMVGERRTIEGADVELDDGDRILLLRDTDSETDNGPDWKRI